MRCAALCPGATRSAFFDRSNMEHSRFVRGPMMGSAEVARAGYEGLAHGKAVVIPGTRNRLLAMSSRLFLRAIVTRVSARITAPVGK